MNMDKNSADSKWFVVNERNQRLTGQINTKEEAEQEIEKMKRLLENKNAGGPLNLRATQLLMG